ncbi:TlpA disulfide reductase family protein [Lacipirellula sp.]|uniref:TlpA disulfide reductase family protein n=1 Tax=Lacipirellula sp. TaxID=2691419 RepID=UPI003D0AF28C
MDRAGWTSKLAAAIISGGGIVPFLAGCSEPAIGAAAAQVAEANDEKSSNAGAGSGGAVTPAGPIVRTAAKPITEEYSAKVPPVMLASEHAAICKVNVGEQFPQLELPKIGGGNAKLADLKGAKATVVLFWAPDRWMAEGALADVAKEAATYGGKGAAFVGVVEGAPNDAGQKLINAAGASLTQLADADGKALAQVGESWLPRVYVLDGQGKVAWFDIEFSEATRRELQLTLAELTK